MSLELIDRELRDRYRLLERVGAGGYGEVWRAEGPGGERVAVKLLHPHHAADPTRVRRFLEEAELTRRAACEHVVSIHDCGSEGDLHFIVMEHLEGRSLAGYLAEHAPLEPELARELLLQLCEGLSVAIQRGIAHRDLSPTNVFLEAVDQAPRVKILDFGNAKEVAAARGRARRRRHSELIGTEAYMAPERKEGRATTIQDLFRADVYSIGVLYCEMLTGVVPPPNPTLRELDACRRQAKTTLSDHEWELVVRCLQTEPSLRYDDAIELSAEVRALVRPSTSPIARGRIAPAAARAHDSTRATPRGRTGPNQTTTFAASTTGADQATPSPLARNVDAGGRAAEASTGGGASILKWMTLSAVFLAAAVSMWSIGETIIALLRWRSS